MLATRRGASEDVVQSRRVVEGTRISAYSPASSVGWLDLDAAASERVATLLRSLEEPDTVDPLGFGSVRDAFSAYAEPGYVDDPDQAAVLRVPAVDLPCARGAAGGADVSSPGGCATARPVSSNASVTSGPSQGVIGYSAGRDLKRMPSEVYWGGLGSWGIRRLDLSPAEYAKRAAALGRLQSRP